MLGWDVTMKFANDVTMSFTDSTKNAHGIRFEGDQGWVWIWENMKMLLAMRTTC